MTTMKYRVNRRAALGLIGGSTASLLIPMPGARVNAQTLDKVSYQTNWRAQTEHGGFYLAAANGIYKKYGLDVEIRPGGPQQNPTQLLLGGRVDMIMGNSLEALSFAHENLPFLCIASIFQKDPQVLISHPGQGNDTLIVSDINHAGMFVDRATPQGWREWRDGMRLLASCEYFTTYHITVDGKTSLFCGDDSFQSFTVLDGSLTIKDGNGNKEALAKGETVFLPAGLGRYKLKGKAEIILSKL